MIQIDKNITNLIEDFVEISELKKPDWMINLKVSDF